MANSAESAEFLLQPLTSTTTTSRRHHKAGHDLNIDPVYDTEETRGETASLAGDGIHSNIHEASTKHTGLLIRDATNKDVKGTPSQRQGHSRNILLTWSFELMLLLLATGLLASIAAVLSAYSDQEVPNWNGSNDGTGSAGITLNALVAIIATVFRAILAFIALEVLAQLKWDWVTAHFRPMSDVQRFDDASRGAWGSLLLLPVVALRQPLAVIAVVVVVASLAIGPMTQQTMQTYYCARVAAGRPAAIQVANRIDHSLFYYSRPSFTVLHVGLQAAILDAVVNPSNDSNTAALFTCPSGNCTFDTYADRPGQPVSERVTHASLGMCSRCENVSELVQVKTVSPRPKSNQVTLSLLMAETGYDPNPRERLEIRTGDSSNGGQYLNSSLTSDLVWARKAVPRDFINTARWSTANFSVLAFSQQNCHNSTNGNLSCPLVNNLGFDSFAWSSPTGFVAATCILYPCVKHYAAIVRNGALSEKVVRSTPLRLQRPQALESGDQSALGGDWSGVQTPCRVNGTLYTSSNMSSASEKLPPDARETVYVHSKDWARQDLDALAGYSNLTAPRECVATLQGGFVSALQWELSTTLGAYCGPHGHQTSFVSCYSKSGGQSLPMVSLLRPYSTNLDTIRENIDSLAMRITTEMRRAGWGPHKETSVTVEGDALESRTCLHVAWAWFVLPAALLLLCAAMIGWVIVKDLLAMNGGVVWKSSVLPFLLRDHVPAMEKMSLREVNAAAKELEVRLKKEE
ncbi:hypothetical protein ACHAPT_013640 [Fusarium lateritium]